MKNVVLAISTFVLLLAGVSCTKDPWGSKCPKGAVDLGIVMTRADGTTYKLYWAKSNLSTSGLCANSEDYGDYYAWGETEPYYTSQDPLVWKDGKTGYYWVSYKFRTSGDNNDNVKFSKYNTKESYGLVDNIMELQRGEKEGETMDDVARAKLGGKWRMPTDAEWTALLTRCTWTWITQNGVNGRLGTASNGNSIFIPAAGIWDGAHLYDAGSSGYYWSSSLYTGHPRSAYNVYFASADGDRYGSYRCDGFSVRPVSE